MEETSKDGEKRCVLGEGLLSANDGPLAELSDDRKDFPILNINGNTYKVIWSCFEKHTSCDNCKFFKEFIELLQKDCFESPKVKNKELEELRDCFTKLLDEEIQESIEEDQSGDTALPESGETILGNLRDTFFKSLRKEFSGELAALGLGPNARSTWDGDNSRVVFQIYNPFYRAFFYRNIQYLRNKKVKEKIKSKLQKYDLASTIDDIKNFEQVPEPLWMISGDHKSIVTKPHENYLIGLAYHTRQMLFKPIPALSNTPPMNVKETLPGTLLGKIEDLESTLAWFEKSAPRRLHVMPLYCYGQPRGVCAIIQADSESVYDGRAHQLQEALSSRISHRIEEEYEREYREKILEETHKGQEHFIVECVRYSPYMLNVVAAAIYEKGKDLPSNLFGFSKAYPFHDDKKVGLKALFENIKFESDYLFNEIERDNEKLGALFNHFVKSIPWPSSESWLQGFIGKNVLRPIESDQKENIDLISLLGITKGTLLVKHYTDNNQSYRLCFLVDCPVTAMRFHANAVDDKFNKLKELYNAFSIKIQQEKQEEKIQELAHLEGVEPRLKEIISTVNTLRDQALEVQGKLFPGRMGLMNFRSDLAPLFRNTGLIHFWVERNGQPCKDTSDEKDPLYPLSLWKVVSEIESASLNLDIKFDEGSLPLGAKEVKIFDAEPFHNIADSSFSKSWELYVPFFYCFGHRKGIPLLKEIAETSVYYKHFKSTSDSTFSKLKGREKKEDRHLFDFVLKEIVHRPFNPYPAEDPREGILSCGLLLSIALEAAKMRTFSKKKNVLNVLFIIKIDGQIIPQEPFAIKSVQNLLDLNRLNKEADELKEVAPKQLVWKSGAILTKLVPADFLAPLYQLLAIELASDGSDENLCCAENFELVVCLSPELKLEACNVNIKCINPLYKEYMRDRAQSKESGLSSCLLKMAECLNQTSPQFLKTTPSDDQKQKEYPFQIYNWVEEKTPKAQIIFTFPRIGESPQ